MGKNDGGDLITHCNSTRVRAVGAGALEVNIFNDVGAVQALNGGTSAELSEISGKAITHLANFRAERICFEIRVTEKDEWFKVSNMFAYVKKTAASYPQL